MVQMAITIVTLRILVLPFYPQVSLLYSV